MVERPRRRRRAGWWVLGLCLIGAALLALSPPALTQLRERLFDALILTRPMPPGGSVVVIDIGREDETGTRWSRAASARLAARLAEAGPAIIGWDIVFAGGCGPEPANLALSATLGRADTVLGFLLAVTPSATMPGPAPALAMSSEAAGALWAAPGAEAPCPGFVPPGVTLGAVSLPGDSSARVRRVPAAVMVAGAVWPSLPIEVLRRAQGLSAPVIAAGGGPMRLHFGAQALPLDTGGTLRFVPQPRARHAARTIPAAEVLDERIDRARLAGRIVLVGSSLPQSGGLRPTAIDPLYPSVQIAADLIEGIEANALPWRPLLAPWVEAGALALAGLGMALALVRLTPPAALALAVGLGALWMSGAVALHWFDARLIDPLQVPLVLVGATLAALVVQAAATARAERALRGRMGQLLPPAVVARLADTPGLLRLAGERRAVTALFTDLEGFTAATQQLEPEALIALLDRYFTLVNAVILRHGGMIDKIVGDAVHALFNAPLDQQDHVEAALAAAAEIITATEALRAELPALGRTRIGIETGPAILGDVGSGGRIDYTAHGACVNLAARLQEAGKVLGPSVIIGPAAAAAARRPLRSLGLHETRSFGALAVFTLA